MFWSPRGAFRKKYLKTKKSQKFPKFGEKQIYKEFSKPQAE